MRSAAVAPRVATVPRARPRPTSWRKERTQVSLVKRSRKGRKATAGKGAAGSLTAMHRGRPCWQLLKCQHHGRRISRPLRVAQTPLWSPLIKSCRSSWSRPSTGLRLQSTGRQSRPRRRRRCGNAIETSARSWLHSSSSHRPSCRRRARLRTGNRWIGRLPSSLTIRQAAIVNAARVRPERRIAPSRARASSDSASATLSLAVAIRMLVAALSVPMRRSRRIVVGPAWGAADANLGLGHSRAT